MRYTDRRSAGQ